jgi:hypothetical protein
MAEAFASTRDTVEREPFGSTSDPNRGLGACLQFRIVRY